VLNLSKNWHLLCCYKGANDIFNYLTNRKGKIMNKEVTCIEEALEVLEALCVIWATVNKIENSLWDTGVAFFDRNYSRVAYYDEANNALSIN
jgi:hypothetical protein